MNAIEPRDATGEIMEQVIVKGDLAKLTPAERSKYYLQVCRSIGLNPLTRPFEYLLLNNKLTLYARRDAADQLRKLNGINIEIASHTVHDGLLTVRVRATDRQGRVDEDFGVVSIDNLRGEAAANAFLKCVTKAKRRVTLSISGLGFFDETEVEDIPAAERTGHAFGHLEAAAADERPPAPAAAASPTLRQPGADPRSEPGAGAAPSWEDYVGRWEVWLDEAERPDQAADLHASWNEERKLRNLIAWPDDDTFERLKTTVARRISELKALQVPT